MPGGLPSGAITPDRWQLPGLTVDLKTELPEPAIVEEGGRVYVTFHVDASQEAALFVLEIARTIASANFI